MREEVFALNAAASSPRATAAPSACRRTLYLTGILRAAVQEAEDKRSVRSAVSVYLHGSLAYPSLGSWRIASAVIAVLLLAAEDMDAAAKVLAKIDKVTQNIEVVVTVSADAAALPEELKKYVI